MIRQVLYTVLSTLIGGSALAQGHPTALGPVDPSLVEQHRAFVEAVQSGSDRIPDFFSRLGALTFVFYFNSASGLVQQVDQFAAEELPTAIGEGRLRHVLYQDYHAAPIGNFVMQAAYSDTVPWRLVAPNTFAPPECITGSRVRVEWRREEGRWVIAALTDEGFDIGREPAWIESAGCLYQQ